MEIRKQSKTGPVVPALAGITAILSRQIDDMKQRLLDRLNHDPASFAQIEVEIHDRFRRLAVRLNAEPLNASFPERRPSLGRSPLLLQWSTPAAQTGATTCTINVEKSYGGGWQSIMRRGRTSWRFDLPLVPGRGRIWGHNS